MARDSIYWIVKDIPTAKQIFKDKFPGHDISILIGEKQTGHITVMGFGKTADGNIIIEIPRTLLELQDEMKLSQYAADMKSRVDIKNFTAKEIDFDVVG